MKIFITILFALSAYTGIAQNAKYCNLSNGVAIEGYDPVSYFSGKAEKGSKTLAVNDGGKIYYFVNAQHADAFRKNPAGYEPQYGGWCAYAMGKSGEKVEIDPATYKVVNGKLYLFYNKYFTNTLKSWNKDETYLKKNADGNWQKVVGK